MCCRGAEYRFRAEWLKGLPAGYDAAYFCGLELEEPTGSLLLDYLEGAGIPQLYFAPGPRLRQIPPQRLERACAAEAPGPPERTRGAGRHRRAGLAPAAAQALAQKTGREVLVTLGSRGAYVERGAGSFFKKASPAVVVDTIGAGDGHMGASVAGRIAARHGDGAGCGTGQPVCRRRGQSGRRHAGSSLVRGAGQAMPHHRQGSGAKYRKTAKPMTRAGVALTMF